jgi:TetR/AcrR family transcriptional regulator
MSSKSLAETPAAAASPIRAKRPQRRAEQQRSVETRGQILNAAMVEFAEKGFEAASIRSIADRIGMQHPLITYHYRNKDALWRAAAGFAFDRIRTEWDMSLPQEGSLSPLERLRLEYRILFRYTALFPEFHRFMRQEAQADTPRLRWVAEMVINPLLDRLLPQIEEAQQAGLLPKVEPLLFHYMMVSLTATLSDFGNEIKVIKGLIIDDPDCIDSYWTLVDEVVFVRSGLVDSDRAQKRARAHCAESSALGET